MADWVRWMRAPRFSDDEKTRKAFLLHVILMVTIALTLVAILTQFFLEPLLLIANPAIYATVAALLGISYALNTRGKVDTAAYAFSFSIASLITVIAHSGTGLLDKIMYLQVVPIFIAGLVVGESGAIYFTLLGVLLNIVLFVASPSGSSPLPADTTEIIWGLIDGITLDGFTGAILFLTARGIRLSLERIREKEAALIRQNQALQHEISERQRTEEDLHSTQALLAAVMDNAPMSIFVIDPLTNQYVMVNRMWEQQTGLSRSQAIGMTVEERLPPETAQRLNASTQQVITTGKPVQLEERIVSGEQEWYVYTIKFPLFNDQQEIQLVGGITLDITELKRAERAVRESEERFRALIEKSSDIITIIRKDGTIGFISPSCESALGYAPDELIGRSQLEFIHPEDRVIAINRFETLLAGQNAIAHIEMRVRHKDGRYVILESVARSLFHVPSIQGMVVNSRDITERREIEGQRMEAETLRRAVEQDRQAIDRKWRFVREMAHELRTPLAVMLSARDMLERYSDRMPPERRQAHLNEIGQQISYMNNVLNDVLTFSKGEAGKLDFSPAPLDLGAFCNTLVEQIQITDKKEHTISLSVDESAMGLYLLDEKLMHNILGNLVSNAVKYSPERSNVRVMVSCREQEISLCVSDEGLAFPPRNRNTCLSRSTAPAMRVSSKAPGWDFRLSRRASWHTGGRLAARAAPGRARHSPCGCRS